MKWSFCRSVHATWSLKSWNIPQCHQQLSIRPTYETDRQRSINVVSRNAPPSGQTSPGHCLCLPLEHLPSQADECKTLAYDLNYLSVLIRETIRVCEILTMFSDFSISIFENIPVLYKHNKLGHRRHSRFCSKGGKPIGLSCVVHIIQCDKLNCKMSESTIKIGKKTKLL